MMRIDPQHVWTSSRSYLQSSSSSWPWSLWQLSSPMYFMWSFSSSKINLGRMKTVKPMILIFDVILTSLFHHRLQWRAIIKHIQRLQFPPSIWMVLICLPQMDTTLLIYLMPSLDSFYWKNLSEKDLYYLKTSKGDTNLPWRGLLVKVNRFSLNRPPNPSSS